MTIDELRAEIRRQVLNFVELDPMLHVQSQRLAPLLDQTLVRVIARDLSPLAPVLDEDALRNLYELHRQRTGDRNVVSRMSAIEAVEHVVEWLTWSVRSNAHWIERKDEDGNILKLAKLGSIKAMIVEADKSIAKLQAGHLEVEDGKDVERIMDLDDGFRMVRLLTPLSLRNETAHMQHCIGLGGYDNRVLAGTDIVYSLRDRRARSHATMHVVQEGEGWKVMELRGKQNRMPLLKYRKLLLPFLDDMRFVWGKAAAHAGILVAEDDRHYPFDDFPKHLAVRDLDVSSYKTVVDVATLPRFSRNLRIGGAKVEALPADFVFPGDLDLEHSEIRQLPPGMYVKGDLNLADTRRIRTLPADLVVEGTLRLDNSRARLIPNGIRFGRLVSHGIPLDLPDGFRATGSMDFSEHFGKIGLPQDLYVPGDLNLAGLALMALPRGLVVEGTLDISNTRIVDLPKGLRIGHLQARNSDLLSLNGLTAVAGNVDISNTRIKRLPWGLRVGGDLDISGTAIGRLPFGAAVGGRVVTAVREDGEGDIWQRLWTEEVNRPKQVFSLGWATRCAGVVDGQGSATVTL